MLTFGGSPALFGDAGEVRNGAEFNNPVCVLKQISALTIRPRRLRQQYHFLMTSSRTSAGERIYPFRPPLSFGPSLIPRAAPPGRNSPSRSSSRLRR